MPSVKMFSHRSCSCSPRDTLWIGLTCQSCKVSIVLKPFEFKQHGRGFVIPLTPEAKRAKKNAARRERRQNGSGE